MNIKFKNYFLRSFSCSFTAMVSVRAYIILIILGVCDSFNFDLNFVDLISIGSSEKYFGYSLLLQKGDVSRIIVGAPISNSSYAVHNSIEMPGAVYKCDIGTSSSCQQYVIESKGNTEVKAGDNRYNFKDLKDHGLMGAAVEGGDNVDDPLYVCSPRWKNDRSDRYGQHYLANGICYGMTTSSNITVDGERYMPLLNAGKQGYTLAKVVKYYYAMGQLGFAMHYVRRQGKLLLGAPGVLGWRGSIVQVMFQDTNTLQIQRRDTLQRQKRQILYSFNVPNPVYISSLEEDNFYFGYSISSGRFVRTYRDLWYAAGSPRAADLYGMVLLFEFPQYEDSDLIVHKKLVGEQFGSYFGGSVLAVAASDVGAQMGIVDLLVGAPTYTTDTWDEGCVYFYKNKGEGNLEIPRKIYGSKKPGARFGTAISAIGDVNKDSFEDVAISAPYEEESGAVYIYLGGEHGLSKDYSQRILGRSIKSSLRGFGFAISRGVDIDNNFHNDFAVGAYKSGDVAIIKSRPVIQFLPQLLSMAKELMLNASEVTVQYCMNYSSSSKNVKKVNVKVTLSKDTRAKDNSDTVHSLTLELNQPICTELVIMIQEGIFDYTKPFSVEMSYALIGPELSEFCANCPVPNPSDSTFIQLNIPFASGCGNDNICRPSLSVNVTTQTNLSSLIIGQLSTIKFHVQVRNDGEPAYISQLFMAFPEDVEILLVSSKCELNDIRIYECLLSNVLQPNVSSELVFEFDIKNLNPATQNLTFNVTAQSRGEEVNPDDNAVSINIPLRIQNGVEISGISFPDSIIFVNENKERIAETVEFTQEYYLKNVGPSPMSGMNATFFFPVEIRKELSTNEIIFGVYEPDVMINNQAVTCKTDYHLGFYSDEVLNGESSELDQDNSREENRFRRSVDASQLSFPDVFDLPANRTILVNCKSDNVTCMKVTCSSSEVLSKNQLMLAKFKLRARVDILIQITSEKDIILFSSTGESTLESKITTYHIPTLLIGSAKEPDISYWFYIGGVFVALVILCIIVLILYKLNFFNRPVREKLQNEADEDTECKELEVDSTMAEEENSVYNT